jgi:hypothetical protein
MEGIAMRDATRLNPEELQPQGRGDGFIVGAIICAAIMVAVIALHGGPDLTGGRFDTGITFQASNP